MTATDPHPIDVAFPDIRDQREGNTGTPFVHRFDSGLPGPHVLLNALTHGNEVCGAIALKDLLDAKLTPRRGRLTVSFANVEAYESFDASKPNASRFVDQDLNRIWSAAVLDDLDKTSSELRRGRELRPFVDEADLLLDLHSMHEYSPPLGLSGPLDKGIALARAIGSPRDVVVDEGHPEGVRMRDYAGFGDSASPKNALLVECGQHWEASSPRVAKDCVARFLLHTGLVSEQDLPADWFLQKPSAQRIIHVTEPVVARSADFRFAEPYTGLEVIPEAGTIVAWREGEPVRTPYANCVLVMPSTRHVRPGVTAVRFGRLVA
jgi:predicted deacylase